MLWLWMPIFIWIIALIIMMLPGFVNKKIQKIKAELEENAESAKYTNPEESVYKHMEKEILDTINIKYLYLSSSIIGSVLIALGTFVFCLVLLL